MLPNTLTGAFSTPSLLCRWFGGKQLEAHLYDGLTNYAFKVSLAPCPVFRHRSTYPYLGPAALITTPPSLTIRYHALQSGDQELGGAGGSRPSPPSLPPPTSASLPQLAPLTHAPGDRELGGAGGPAGGLRQRAGGKGAGGEGGCSWGSSVRDAAVVIRGSRLSGGWRQQLVVVVVVVVVECCHLVSTHCHRMLAVRSIDVCVTRSRAEFGLVSPNGSVKC